MIWSESHRLAFVIPINSETAQNTCSDKSSHVGVCQSAHGVAWYGGNRSGQVERSEIETRNAQRLHVYDAAHGCNWRDIHKNVSLRDKWMRIEKFPAEN